MNINWDKIHDKMKYIDPVGRFAVDQSWKTGTKSVGGWADATGWDWLERNNDKDKVDFDRTMENSLAGFGIVYGGMEGAGYLGEGGSGAGAGSAGYIDSGTVVPGAEVGSNYSQVFGGADFSGGGGNPWAGASSSPTGGGGGFNWGQMAQMGGGMGGKGGQNPMAGALSGGGSSGGGSGRQNLPLMENEKTEQQKLAELLKALSDQQGYA